MRRTPVSLSLSLSLLTTCGAPVSPPTDVAVFDAALDAVAPDALPDAAPDVPYEDPFRCESASTARALTDRLAATEARSGRATRAEELVRGEGAYGRVGDYVLYNDRVRFVVQQRVDVAGPVRPIGYGLYGGNLIDADRERAAGERGHDVFREMFPTVALRAPSAMEVTVVCDGSNGRPAALRVMGTDQPTRLLPALDAIAPRRNLRVITHYILRPGTEVLEIHTRSDSLGGIAQSGLTGDFLAFGSALKLFSPVTGYGDPSRAMGSIPYLIGAGDPGENGRRVSYGLAARGAGIEFPFADESGTFGSYGELSAPANRPVEFVRYFSVGDGDVASAAAPLLRARGDVFGTASGRTAPGALVYAFMPPFRAGAAARMVARASDTGAYSLPLAPGAYELIAVAEGALRGAAVRVEVRANETAMAAPMPGASGTLVLDLATSGDGAGRTRAPVRVALEGMGVEAPDPSFGDLPGERENQGLHRAIFSLTGAERVAVKPGRYRATVSRGPEYDVSVSEVTVPAGGETTLRADLPRVLDTAGFVSGDFHQHTVGSVDSGRSLCNRVLENVANGLEYASTTDHENATDFAPCTRELALTRWFGSTIGNEISVVGLGHFNAYPLRPDPADPYALLGAQYWVGRTAQSLFDRVRAERSDPILHLSHPRSGSLKGYFVSVSLDPTTGVAGRGLATGFEALEVNESLGEPAQFLASFDAEMSRRSGSSASSVPVLRDWFGLLARGSHACALGNSDTHDRNDNTGWPRNFLRVGVDDPALVTETMVREAIRAQRVAVSNGAVLRVRNGGMDRMGWREVVTSAPAGGAVELEVELQAASWVPVREVLVYENGRPMALRSDGRGGYDATVAASAVEIGRIPAAATGPSRFRGVVRVRPARDAFYVFVARGDALPIAGRGDSYGYTNPVYVDADGGGWRMP